MGMLSRRDIMVDFVKSENGVMAELTCPFCEKAIFPCDFALDVSDRKNDFLEKLAKRTSVIIESLAYQDEACHVWQAKNGGGSRDDFLLECKFLERMDVLFDDAENFVDMVLAGDGEKFGYAIFSTISDWHPNCAEKASFIVAYKNGEILGGMEISSEAGRFVADMFAAACARQDEQAFEEALAQARQTGFVSADEAFKTANSLYPIETEFSEEKRWSSRKSDCPKV